VLSLIGNKMLKEELEDISLKIKNKQLLIIDPWDTEKGHKNNCIRVYQYNNYAIKCVHLKDDINLIHSTTLKNGYNITKNLDHPGIIKSYSYYSNNEIEFTVLECIKKTLKSILNIISKEQKIYITEEVKKSIYYLWQNGITHYDLTTKNILIRNNLQPVIIDFQIAKKMIQPEKFDNCIDMRKDHLIVQNCCGPCKSVNFNDLKEEIWKIK
jgi:serine/threonine protein kinase